MSLPGWCSLVVGIMALCGALSAQADLGQAVPPGVIRVAFADGSNLSGGRIQYQLTSDGGAHGSAAETTRDRRQYDFPGWSAAAFKAIVYVPGYRFVLIDDPSGSTRRASPFVIDLERLGTLSLRGTVTAQETGDRATLVVDYFAFWAHEFFGRIDGLVPAVRVAAEPLAADGSFAIAVPDFANDPVVRSRFITGAMKERGAFALRLQTAAGQPVLLEDAATPGVPLSVAIAGEYAQGVSLRPLTRR